MNTLITTAIQPGQVLAGALYSEPMRVETVGANGPEFWELGLVGQQSGQFLRATLDAAELGSLTVTSAGASYDGDGGALRLGLRAYALGIAYEFDPYFALSMSRVDPLPHQLEAVYHYLLKLPSVRFLLADDAGAGKTIMAGLLIRELKLRGLAERIAVVCPANLTFQWQRELGEKFGEKFLVLKGSDIRNQFGANEWQERNQVIILNLVRTRRLRALTDANAMPYLCASLSRRIDQCKRHSPPLRNALRCTPLIRRASEGS